MFSPVKEKVFRSAAYRALTAKLADFYCKKIRLINSCPDCKAVVGLNAFGFLVDANEKPEACVFQCRECDHLYVSPVFV